MSPHYLLAMACLYVLAALVFLPPASALRIDGAAVHPKPRQAEAGSELVKRMQAVEVALSSVAGNVTAASASDVAKPEPKQTPSYSESTCDMMFAYADARAQCRRLQQKICGRQCARLTRSKTEAAQCRSLQETLCVLPQMPPFPVPLNVGEVPKGEKPVTITVCNARPGEISALWVAVYGEEGPRPMVPDLSYLDCAQLAGWSGLDVVIYSGSSAMASYRAEERNVILMVGANGIDDTENVLFHYTFEDEGYQRPILCNGAHAEKNHLKVMVEGRKWYPFVIRGVDTKVQPEGKIMYLECEVLALDHADNLQRQEDLEFWSGEEFRGEVTVNPVKTLFLLGNAGPDGREELVTMTFSLGSLKYVKK